MVPNTFLDFVETAVNKVDRNLSFNGVYVHVGEGRE